MSDDYFGFQQGETPNWAAAYAQYPQPVQLKDLIGAVGELAEWRDVPPATKIVILGMLDKKRAPRGRVLSQITKLTGIEFVESDIGGDVNLVIVIGQRLAKEHASDLKSFALKLYDESGYTHLA